MNSFPQDPNSTRSSQHEALNAKPSTLYGIALGSNLGDRLWHFQQAVAKLLQALPSAKITAAAPLYETDPVDCPEGSQSFYNTVLELKTDLEPLALLNALQALELSLGRSAVHGHNAPRTVDLDILYAGDATMNHPDLILPHPRMMQRRFVLQPLADIRPDLVLPGQTHCITGLLITLDSPEPPLRLVQKQWLPSIASRPH
ncbi:2-amino-4-hydroxy-6-hydroxymethyldihydropteridinediphosphokinase [soil metagenome]